MCVCSSVCACKMSSCLVGGVEVVRTCSHPQNPWEKHTFLCLPFKGLPESSCASERAARQRCLFWFPKEIRLITPAARSRIWGRAKTSNKNLRLQEIWKATAAPDSCPSKLDCVLRGDCTHEQSGLWWACQMTLIADRRIDCFHRQKWPPPAPPARPHPHSFHLKILLTMRWETTRSGQQLLRSGIKSYRKFWLVGIWGDASWVKKKNWLSGFYCFQGVCKHCMCSHVTKLLNYCQEHQEGRVNIVALEVILSLSNEDILFPPTKFQKSTWTPRYR